MINKRFPKCLAILLSAGIFAGAAIAQAPAASDTAEWRIVDPANTLYMDIDAGRVVIEML